MTGPYNTTHKVYYIVRLGKSKRNILYNADEPCGFGIMAAGTLF